MLSVKESPSPTQRPKKLRAAAAAEARLDMEARAEARDRRVFKKGEAAPVLRIAAHVDATFLSEDLRREHALDHGEVNLKLDRAGGRDGDDESQRDESNHPELRLPDGADAVHESLHLVAVEALKDVRGGADVALQRLKRAIGGAAGDMKVIDDVAEDGELERPVAGANLNDADGLEKSHRVVAAKEPLPVPPGIETGRSLRDLRGHGFGHF